MHLLGACVACAVIFMFGRESCQWGPSCESDAGGLGSPRPSLWRTGDTSTRSLRTGRAKTTGPGVASGIPELIGSSREHEHDMVMITMEAMTAAHDQGRLQGGYKEGYLKDRSWSGNSHIGNRREQSTWYYDLARELRPRKICEIGMNGGHSAALFLMAADDDASLVMFDLLKYSYSSATVKLVQSMFPLQIEVIKGDSTVEVPKLPDRTCDLFSVDGDHRYPGAKLDIYNAINKTKVGGTLILDDMQLRPTRQAFDEVVREGLLTEINCIENVPIVVSRLNRKDTTNVRRLQMSWCTGKVPPAR